MSDRGSSSKCDHGPSCCTKCRKDISNLRSELEILRFQLNSTRNGVQDEFFSVPGLDDKDAGESATIRGCLEPAELGSDGVPTKYKVKDALLETLRSHREDRTFVARRLTDLLFTKAERTSSNVQGKKQKPPLDIQRMEAVRDGTFKVCPVESKKDEEVLWKECIKSIDSASRGLGRDRSKKAIKRPHPMSSPSSSTTLNPGANMAPAATVGANSYPVASLGHTQTHYIGLDANSGIPITVFTNSPISQVVTTRATTIDPVTPLTAEIRPVALRSAAPVTQPVVRDFADGPAPVDASGTPKVVKLTVTRKSSSEASSTSSADGSAPDASTIMHTLATGQVPQT